jgi:glycosyltransferase involved in cell wall biosynthesis
VLYANHTARIGGGERSLLLLLSGLPPGVRPVLACPAGILADTAARLGLAVTRVPGTDSSLRVHPWHTARGMVDVARAALSLRRRARRLGADLVHANTIRAGLAASLAAALGGPPAVVHVRDCLPPTRLSLISRAVIGRGAAAVIANSGYTARSFGVPGTQRIYNPVDVARLQPDAAAGAATRAALGLSATDLVLTVVAQITPWKGQLDALRAFARLAPRRPALQLLIAGTTTFDAHATRYDNEGYLRALREFASATGLERRVHFLGERADVRELLAASDVVLAPSWEEPFGRSIAEAMAMAIPVVATAVGGPAEIVRDGVDGFLLPPHDPARWADAIERLLAAPEMRSEMGRQARRRAVASFAVPAHVRDVVGVYESVLATTRHSGSRSVRL